MVFKKILKEIFSDEKVDKQDPYTDKKVGRDSVPYIVQNGLNDVNPDGTLKKRKKGEIR